MPNCVHSFIYIQSTYIQYIQLFKMHFSKLNFSTQSRIENKKKCRVLDVRGNPQWGKHSDFDYDLLIERAFIPAFSKS